MLSDSSNFEEQQQQQNIDFYIFDVQTLESKLLLNSRRFDEDSTEFLAFEDTFIISGNGRCNELNLFAR